MAFLNDAYSRPLLRAGLIQFVLLFFFSLFLDFGVMLRACSYSSAAFWLSTIIIMVRRRASPTQGDLAYIRWGLLFLNLIGIPVFLTVWRLKGAIS